MCSLFVIEYSLYSAKLLKKSISLLFLINKNFINWQINIKNKHQTGKNSLLDACKVIKIDDIYFTSSIILPPSSSAWMLSGMSE
jgi:hypothetical protein